MRVRTRLASTLSVVTVGRPLSGASRMICLVPARSHSPETSSSAMGLAVKMQSTFWERK